MSEVMETVGGFRSAIQDLLVPELKAVQVEIRSVKETLDRHERWLERHDQSLAQILSEIRENNKEQNEKFASVVKSIHDLQKDMAVVISRLGFAERLTDLEIQIARLTKSAKPKKGGRLRL